jgi:hypothetical protein
VDGGAVVFSVLCELQPYDAQGKDRCGRGPELICRNEARQKPRKFPGIGPLRDDETPRLFVV